MGLPWWLSWLKKKKKKSAKWETWVWSLGWEDPLGKGMTVFLPGEWSMGLQKIRHNWVTKHSTQPSSSVAGSLWKKSSGHRYRGKTLWGQGEDGHLQGERPQKKPNLPTAWCLTSSLQKREKINFCCLDQVTQSWYFVTATLANQHSTPKMFT